MADKCSLLKDVKTFTPEDEKVLNLTLVGVQTPPEEVRGAACYQCSKSASIR